MQKVNITLALDEEKLRALETYLKMEGSTLQKKMEAAVGELYEQVVPKPVQEYVEAVSGAKPKRPAPTPKLQTDPKSKQGTQKAVGVDIASLQHGSDSRKPEEAENA